MRFADITGQEDLKRHLTQSVDAGRVSHAQLFTGTAGSRGRAVAVAPVPVSVSFSHLSPPAERGVGDTGGAAAY